jgi:DNA-binding response OmpR family regulator
MPNILIVEDDKAISNLIYLNLSMAGYEQRKHFRHAQHPGFLTGHTSFKDCNLKLNATERNY